MNLNKLPFLILSTAFFSLLSASAIILPPSPSLTSLPITTQLAQVTSGSVFCNTYTNSSQPPTGFAVSYNLFSTAKELLLSALCNTNNTVTLTSGNGANTTYIWSQAYYTRDSQTWTPITLTGSQTAGNGQWIIGTAQTTQSLTTAEQANQNYYASYVCTYTANTWKCGCSDTTCATPKWNLQGIRKTASSQPATGGAGKVGVFPGTNLNFFPGISIENNINATAANYQKEFDTLLSGTVGGVSRKIAWRPSGLYVSIIMNSSWKDFYTDPSKRPLVPWDPDSLNNAGQPAYNWDKLVQVLSIDAVANDGAKIIINAGDRYGRGGPNWFLNEPYVGKWVGANAASDVGQGYTKYYRYGSDRYHHVQVGDPTRPPATDEYLYFVEALRNKVKALNAQDKVTYFALNEVNTGDNQPYPDDYNSKDYSNGVIYRDQTAAALWAEIGVPVSRGSPGGIDGQNGITNSPNLIGVSSPDPKIFMSGYPPSSTSAQGYMAASSDIRPVMQQVQPNGIDDINPWPTGVVNPYTGLGGSRKADPIDMFWYFGKNGVVRSHILSFSIYPVGTGYSDPNKVNVSWIGATGLANIQAAYDQTGPAGDKTFPYLPPGYRELVPGY